MTNRDEMKPTTRYWWSNNFLGVMMVLMLGSYFAYDLMDKHQNRIEHAEFVKSQVSNTEKFRVFAMILINDPNTDPESRQILREYLKLDVRGGSVN